MTIPATIPETSPPAWAAVAIQDDAKTSISTSATSMKPIIAGGRRSLLNGITVCHIQIYPSRPYTTPESPPKLDDRLHIYCVVLDTNAMKSTTKRYSTLDCVDSIMR